MVAKVPAGIAKLVPSLRAQFAWPGRQATRLRLCVDRGIQFLGRVGVVLGQMGLLCRQIMPQNRIFLRSTERLVPRGR